MNGEEGEVCLESDDHIIAQLQESDRLPKLVPSIPLIIVEFRTVNCYSRAADELQFEPRFAFHPIHLRRLATQQLLS